MSVETLAHVDLRIDGDLMRRAFGPAFPKDALGVLSQGFMDASDEAEKAREEILIQALKPALHCLMSMHEGQSIVGEFGLRLFLDKVA